MSHVTGNTTSEAETSQLRNFLYQQVGAERIPTEATLSQLNPENFYDFLGSACFSDNEAAVVEAVSLFCLYATAEFTEPTVAEESLTKMTKRVSSEIDTFIDNGKLRPNFGFVGVDEVYQLSDIYSKHNLLALAKELVEKGELGLTTGQLDMIYRYRVSLKMIEEKAEQLGTVIRDTRRQEQNNTRDGARTWAGVIRAYGVETGFIDCGDFGACDGERVYEDLPDVVTLKDGSTVRLSGMHSVDGPSEVNDYET